MQDWVINKIGNVWKATRTNLLYSRVIKLIHLGTCYFVQVFIMFPNTRELNVIFISNASSKNLGQKPMNENLSQHKIY